MAWIRTKTGTAVIWSVIGVATAILVPVIGSLWSSEKANADQINTTRVDVAVLQTNYANINDKLDKVISKLDKLK